MSNARGNAAVTEPLQVDLYRQQQQQQQVISARVWPTFGTCDHAFLFLSNSFEHQSPQLSTAIHQFISLPSSEEWRHLSRLQPSHVDSAASELHDYPKNRLSVIEIFRSPLIESYNNLQEHIASAMSLYGLMSFSVLLTLRRCGGSAFYRLFLFLCSCHILSQADENSVNVWFTCQVKKPTKTLSTGVCN
jgi:hypothetical protein